MTKHRPRRKTSLLAKVFTSLKLILIITGLSVIAPLVTWKWSLPWLGSLLVTEDQPAQDADYIVIMMGETAVRANQAIRLYRQGFGQRILFIHPEDSPDVLADVAMNDGDATRKILLAAGIPEDAIEYDRKEAVTSTVEEVKAILTKLANRNQPIRATVVTSWYHTSRVKWNFWRLNDNQRITIHLSPAYPANISQANWIADERSFLQVFEEYLKWLHSIMLRK
jgi:uncharacterized SAM-binding protein YcdF (DUF218 family)